MKLRKSFVGFILATAGLVGYYLMIKYAQHLVYERLAFLLVFEFAAILVFFLDRQEKQKREVAKRVRNL